MALLGNRFAPATFKFGFLRADLEQAIHHYVRWQHAILRMVSKKSVTGPLDVKLEQILPLQEFGERMLFSATQSDWLAIFDNGVVSGTANNVVAILSEKMRTSGLAITDIPNTFTQSGTPFDRGVWGAVAMSAYDRLDSGEWGLRRAISLRNDVSGWKFQQIGAPWDFEDIRRYNLKPKKNRLDSDLLASYFGHFGIRIYDKSFYDGPGIATYSRFPLNPKAKTFELGELQKKMRIEASHSKPSLPSKVND